MPPDEWAPCRTGSWGWLCSLGVKRWKEWSKALYLRVSHRRIPLLFSTLCGSRQISRNRLTQIPFVYFPELNLNFPGAGLFFFFFFFPTLLFIDDWISWCCFQIRCYFEHNSKKAIHTHWEAVGGRKVQLHSWLSKETPQGVEERGNTKGTKVTENYKHFKTQEDAGWCSMSARF